MQAVEDLLVFDARCLDKETWHELLRVLPDLNRIGKAWKAHFQVHGCVSCRRKKTEYGAGGSATPALRASLRGCGPASARSTLGATPAQSWRPSCERLTRPGCCLSDSGRASLVPESF